MIVTAHDKPRKKRPYGEIFFLIMVYTFAAVGALFVSVFFANRFKITNVPGSVDILSNRFQKNYTSGGNEQVLGVSNHLNSVGVDKEITDLNIKKQQLILYLCSLKIITPLAPKNTLKVIEAKQKDSSIGEVNSMIFTIKNHLQDLEETDLEIKKCTDVYQEYSISEEKIKEEATRIADKNIFVWPDNKEWSILVEGVTKDREIIKEVASLAKIEPRLIVSSLVVEQLRLFYSQRELYKKFFEPLKILANANKFSLGVMSIKEETAVNIEKHLTDPDSPYYLGKDYEKMLSYPENINNDVGNERYNRLTANNHYYNYLYGALYLKQFITQWEKSGYDISERPEIIGTLFNLGFEASKPNANPMVGGSNISIGETNYSFGRLASEFYYSGEMIDSFPYQKAN